MVPWLPIPLEKLEISTLGQGGRISVVLTLGKGFGEDVIIFDSRFGIFVVVGCSVGNNFALVIEINLGLSVVASWTDGFLILLQDIPGMRTWSSRGAVPIGLPGYTSHSWYNILYYFTIASSYVDRVFWIIFWIFGGWHFTVTEFLNLFWLP